MVTVKVLAVLSILWLMFIEGLAIERPALTQILRRPLALLRVFLVVDVLVPAIAWVLIRALQPELHVGAVIALVAACPIAPLAMRRTVHAAGQRELTASIHLLLGVLSVITTPVTLALLGTALGVSISVGVGSIARNVLLVVVLPLVAGMAVSAWWPSARRLSRPGGRGALALLTVIFLLVILSEWRALAEIQLRGLATLAAFVAAALLAGHLVGASRRRDRPVVAMEAASRNLGLALYIASSQLGQRAALPFLIPYVIVFLVVSTIYLQIVRRLA